MSADEFKLNPDLSKWRQIDLCDGWDHYGERRLNTYPGWTSPPSQQYPLSVSPAPLPTTSSLESGRCRPGHYADAGNFCQNIHFTQRGLFKILQLQIFYAWNGLIPYHFPSYKFIKIKITILQYSYSRFYQWLFEFCESCLVLEEGGLESLV